MIVMKQTKNEMFFLTSPSIPFFSEKKRTKTVTKNKRRKQSLLFFKQSKLPVKIFTFDSEDQQKFLHPAAKQNNNTMQNEKKKRMTKETFTPKSS